MKETVILTGANGYLGFYVCQELIRQGFEVIAIKWNHKSSKIVEHPSVQYYSCDITDYQLLNETIHPIADSRNIVAIINTAALLGSADYDKNYAVNAGGVRNLLQLAKAIAVKRFIQISSVVVNKAIKGPYGETKLIGQNFVVESELDYTIFIPAMILGPESLGLNRILANVFRFPLVVPLIGNGAQTQHPIYVKDFARAIVKAIHTDSAKGKIYQIAGDTVITFRDFIRMILKIKGKRKVFIPIPVFVASFLGSFFQRFQKIPVFTAEHVKGILQDSKLDTKALQEDLGFEPTPLSEALSTCLDAIGENWASALKSRPERSIKL